MAYEKTEWKSGDTITAEKLNKIEDGIENNSSGLIIEFNFDNSDVQDPKLISKKPVKTEVINTIKTGGTVTVHIPILSDGYNNEEAWIVANGYVEGNAELSEKSYLLFYSNHGSVMLNQNFSSYFNDEGYYIIGIYYGD